MENKNFSFSVIVNDKEVTEYSDGFDTFIEGRKGSEYKLKFVNNKNARVLVVPSIDGISVFDGKPATLDSLGIIVNAKSSIIIPGWMVDSSTVASFLFRDSQDSYAGDVSGNTTQAGVIGVLVYAEEEPTKPEIVNNPVYIPYPVEQPKSPWVSPWDYNHITWTTNTGNISYNINTVSLSSSSSTSSATRSVSAERRINPNVNTDFNLGTSWGSSQEFKTTSKSFERGDIETSFLIFYDSRKNLERRGIIQTYQSRTYSKPQAFQGLGGCNPPKGWTK